MTQRHSEKIRSSLSLKQHLHHTRSYGTTLAKNLPKKGSDASVVAASQARPRFAVQGATPSASVLSRCQTPPPSQNRLTPPSAMSHGTLPSEADANAEIEVVRRAIAQSLHGTNALDQGCIMHLTINADCVTQLRHVVIGTCGELVAFMRIQPIAHATRMKVWLGLSKAGVDRIMAIVMQNLPGAEFGQVRPL